MKPENHPAVDPVLKQAAKEIEAVLSKHGIGGFFVLGSRTHGETRIFFPDWSKIQPVYDEKGAVALHLRASKTDDRADVEASIGFVLSCRDACAVNFRLYEGVVKALGQHFEIEHTPFKDFVPHVPGTGGEA